MSAAQQIDAILSTISAPSLPTIDLSLDRMHALLEALGNPHLQLPPVVHVAGTNGKGSTIAFIKSVCEAAGLSVHRYTSPHLVNFHERIEVCGQPVDDDALLAALQQVQRASGAQPVTFFEATTAAAFVCFSQAKADVLLLEVGLGGRFDATNVVPETLLSVITPVAYDHQDFLGNTLTSIAHEKAGIMRSGGVCITAPQAEEAMHEIRAVAKALYVDLRIADVRVAEHLELGLKGAHQRINAATAIAVCEALQRHFPIHDVHIAQGISRASWPARLQYLTQGPVVTALPNADIYLDGGHNPHAAAALADWLKNLKGPKHIWLAMRRGKDVRGFLEQVAPLADSISLLPIAGCPDALSPSDLAALLEGVTNVPIHTYDSFSEAAKRHNCAEKATILICGSLYLAGNILKYHR